MSNKALGCPKQLIVAAGGRGSRMSEQANHQHNKPLIEIDGQPVIYNVLSLAKQADFSQFLITVNESNYLAIKKIADSLDINYLLRLTAPGFRGIPLVFEDVLDERFALVCGHHPIPLLHYHTMFESSQNYELVFSAFPLNGRDKKIFIDFIYKKEGILTKKLSTNTNTYYIDSPFIATKNMARLIKDNHFDISMPQLAYEYFKDGGKISAVKANFPSEFDIDDEYRETEKYLRNYLRDC